MKQGKRKMPRTNSNQDLLMEELRTIQSEMKSANMKLERLSVIADSTLSQTTKTNGRVNKLEERMNVHRGGLMVAYVIIVLIAVPLMIAWIK
jgi:predicted nuclease with TOPRIM domain